MDKQSNDSLKSVPKDNVGLSKLPTSVRNKMGYMKKGGKVGKPLGCGVAQKGFGKGPYKKQGTQKMKKKAVRKSKVNQAGNYTKPTMRKRLFNKIKAGSKGGNSGQWSARKAQMMAKQYKAAGGGYK